MKFTKLFAVVMAFTMMTVSLASCGGSNDAPSQEPEENASGSEAAAPEENAAEEQTLTLVNSDCKVLDVNDVRNANEFILLSHIQEGLFRVLPDEEGNPVLTNAGCESYEVSEDGMTYTFKLRPQKWSDGVDVTAQQYVDSILRLLDSEKGFSYSFMAYDILNAEAYYDGKAAKEDVGVRAIDDMTLEIKLQANIPFFIKKLSNVCFFPVRLDVIEKAGEQGTYNADYTKHVFNGPFIISERILGNEIVLTKNENYWDAENVKLQKVTLKEIDEDSTKSILLENKELDAVEATTEYVNKWKKMTDEGRLVNVSKTSPSVNYMCFNQHTGGSSGLMNNNKVRLALSLAIDREEMNELVYSGVNTPAYGLIPYELSVGDKEFRSLAEEPLKAVYAEYAGNNEKLQSLFKEGVKEVTGSDDISNVTLTIISSGATVQNQAQLEYFKQTWEEKIGCKINVNILADSSLFKTERNENRYDLVYMGWNGDYDDPMTFMELWNTESGYAKFMGGYHNEKFDEMFDSLTLESDNEKRAETYIAMEKNLVAEEAGMSPVYFSNKQYFLQNYVKNLIFPTFGADYEFSRAYIAGK